MVSRIRFWLAAALGLCMAHPVYSAEPALLGMAPSPAQSRPTLSPNQALANTIAFQLRQSGHLRRYNVNIVCQNGLVELSGIVTDQIQREEVLRIVQGVPGVDRVRDHLRLLGASPVTLAQAVTQPAPVSGAAPELNPVPKAEAAPRAEGTGNGSGFVEPTPVFQAAPPYDLNPPKMPPNAWPSYAPYNNYSRVAYPTLYPYNSWPFIGPCYPFPKVPLGWRSVKLTWQDGHWWYARTATGHDFWRLRFW